MNFYLRHDGSVGIITDQAGECPVCHVMSHFFVGKQGKNVCVGCETEATTGKENHDNN